jgi:transcriptional regulator with XRE-family HTH domain
MDFHNFGNLIKSKRKEKGYTQAELSDLVGITTQHYSRLERGEFVPSLQTFLSLIQVLELNLSELEVGSQKTFTSTMYEIMHLLENFTNTQQKAVLTFLKTMA